MKKLLPFLSVLALVGCGNNTADTPKQEKVTAQSNSASSATTITKPSIDWYQDDLTKPVKMVGVENAKAVIDSAGLKVAKSEKSTDSKGEPKTIYLFSPKTLSAQFEHSPNQINLQWFQLTDEKKSSVLDDSQQSLKDIYLVARALFGKDGADAVRRVSIGGKYRDDLIGGFKTNGQCNNGICFLIIKIK